MPKVQRIHKFKQCRPDDIVSSMLKSKISAM